MTPLKILARNAMRERGFEVDFSPSALQQSESATPLSSSKDEAQDLRHLFWSSIDNDDTKDLDQLEYIQAEGSAWRLYIAIAYVDAYARRATPIDQHAYHNTTSVYTGVETFPMLPQRLSENLSSLVEGQDRLAMVVDMSITSEGRLNRSTAYQAWVKNQAQLTYEGVAAWLDKSSRPLSPVSDRIRKRVEESKAIQDQLTIQVACAQRLAEYRKSQGSLSLSSVEWSPVFQQDGSIQLMSRESNPATRIIENFMVMANQCTERFLEERKFPLLLRVVRTPKKWDRIVALAAERGKALPSLPDSKALDRFLVEEHVRDPDGFPDLSLAVVKCLGRGEYVVLRPGETPVGHFGLALQRYSHSTAPNRRYPDLVTQRLLLSAMNGQTSAYKSEELDPIAQRCTDREDAANKVERFVRKCLAASAVRSYIGQEFDGIITGSSGKGIFVRLKNPPVEGKIVGRVRDLQVGQHVRVRLTHTDPERGHIDFECL